MAGLTPIQAAAAYGDIRSVRDLISLGADVNSPATDNGMTALLAALKNQSLPLLKLLVQHGANVNHVIATKDCKFISPLGEAARLGWLKGVEFLLKHGLNVHDSRLDLALFQENELSDFLSPLGWAIKNRAEKMVALLLQHGADVRATVWSNNWRSASALIYALICRSSFEVIYRLIEKVPDLEDHPGWEDALEFVIL
ncbi:ankyrin repeat domain-containing protein [Aspergillus clavatus NRRL 1]|uniref:Ankyrin repeat protein n=1 Tax=Aspergillus clavatus (strain ATCC 1007 / CBS 513.65 / DSM 816 / NCTC 3887 / NRRL 1 / QM 1276 / 107) TaxID=344612 RepID=A1CLR5_ASPCL|nr:Ankyrin repeat protein [Aspergillus clavatus NRRL 1]EAW09044.1 Ankyrin repeat protein [Aspergillus clavatus NRRL 1]